jgi:hypothetical protein
MIADTTYFKEEVRDEINDKLGKPFTFRDIIKLGAIGSSRMVVDECSPAFYEWVNSNQDLTQASIELRPKGILVVLAKNYHNMSWAIPYHLLAVFKTNVLSLHAEGHYLKLKLRQGQNKKFLFKMMDQRVKYLGDGQVI